MTPRKLFISYRSSDAAKVDRIAKDLTLIKHDDGTPRFSAWQDKHNLPPASPNWWDAIVDAIIDSDIFVFNLSQASLTSAVCLAELDYAHRRNRPIISVVLDGEFSLDPKSGKYDLPKATWALVPDWLGEQQLLFYVHTQFYGQFQAAVAMFERKWPRDIPAPRPLNPDNSSVHGSNHALYGAACEYAERLVFAEAEKHFGALVRRNDSDYADFAATWLNLLRRYSELIEIVTHRSPTAVFNKKWAEYLTLFPNDAIDGGGIFDPRNFRDRFALPPPPPKLTPTRQQQQAPRKLTVADILPAPFAWCPVPAGEFMCGEKEQPSNPPRKLTLPAFEIAKHPITWEQFQVFLDADDGFKRADWWQGLAADDAHRAQPGDQAFKLAGHPRENVSWYDAIAFCRWLSARMGGPFAIERPAEWAVRLPTEWEWEKAARGEKGLA